MKADGESYALDAKKPTITITGDGKVGGFASVNRYFGGMEVDSEGNVVWPGPFGATRMAGPENLMEQESAFLAAIPKTEQIQLEGDILTLSSGDGATVMVFGK